MLLDVTQKKGDPKNLDGHLTVYAAVDIDPAELAGTSHPVASAISNGLLVANGNFKDQSNLKDFLQSEMGLSLEEGLEEIIERLDGLESALDPQKLKEKIESMKEFEDFIPTPAKIVPFHSEEEVLSQEGDVFFVGSFRNIGNANLSVNAFPILYQARYREQQIRRVKTEIDQLISQIERGQRDSEEEHYSREGADVGEKILKDYIPNMLYSRKDPKLFSTVRERFRSFMRGYRFPQDIDRIVSIIGTGGDLSADSFRLLELYAKKVAGVTREDFGVVESVCREIDRMEEGQGGSAGHLDS